MPCPSGRNVVVDASADVRVASAGSPVPAVSAVPAVPAAPRWMPGERGAEFSPEGILECVRRFREPVHIVRGQAGYEPGLGLGGTLTVAPGADGYELVGTLPGLYPEWLGDRSFNRTHGVRFPYVAGEM